MEDREVGLRRPHGRFGQQRLRSREVAGVDGLERRLPFKNQLLVARTGKEQEQRLVGLHWQARLHGIQVGLVSHRSNVSEHCRRHAQALQFAVLESVEGARLVLGSRSVERRIDRLRDLLARRERLRGIHLQRAGLGVDAALVLRGPVVGIVVPVGPEQHVDVALLGLQHDGPIALVDAQRAHVRVASRLDALVVEAR